MLPTKKEIKKDFDHYKEIVNRFNEICEKRKEKEKRKYAVTKLRPLFDRFVAQNYETKKWDEKGIEIVDFEETKCQHHAFVYDHDDVYITFSEQTNPGGNHFYADIDIDVDKKCIYRKNSDGFESIFCKKYWFIQ